MIVLEEINELLFCAVQEDDVAKARALIDTGADVNMKVWYRSSGLIYHVNSAEMFNFLVSVGIKIKISTLEDMASTSRATIIQCLLDFGLPVNGVEDQGNLTTALMMAAGSGNLISVKLLLENGADPCIFGRRTRWTALHFAANNARDVREEWDQRPHLEIIDLLLQHGANIEAQDDEGMTALIRAAYNLQAKVTQHLLQAGAYVHAVDLSNRTALGNAERRNHRKKMEADAALKAGKERMPSIAHWWGQETVGILKDWIATHPLHIDPNTGEILR